MPFANHKQPDSAEDDYVMVLAQHIEPTIIDHVYGVLRKCVCYSLHYCVVGGEILCEVLENIPDLPPLHSDVYM